MNKPYIFMEDSYMDLYSLSQAYIKHFDEGMNDIYANTKNLFKFIKSRINNKAKIKDYVDILSTTKYKSNALTFMIFEMTEHKDIIIGGVKLDLLSYLQALRENPDPMNNILFGFLEDGGITKTYAKAGYDPKLCSHSLAIERNYRNPFTYKYLTAYYGYESKESLEGKVRSITINGEECFRRFAKLASQESFLISLAHKVGFTETIVAVKDFCPAFQALKLLKKEVEEESLRKIVDKSYFWWMLEDDNFDKYDYKSKASKIYKKFLDIKKEYDHYQALIKAKKISSISFDNYIDISHELYDNYLCFVSAYHNDLITVKKKFDPEQYAPDKAYNKTYICQAFMAGKIVKLYNPEPVVSRKTNPLTGEEIIEEIKPEALDDVSEDKPELKLPFELVDTHNVAKQEKLLNKQYNFSRFSLRVGLISIIPALVIVLIAKFLTTGFFEEMSKNYSLLLGGYVLYGVFAAYVLLVLFAGISLKKIVKARMILGQYDRLMARTEVNDLLEEEKILFEDEKKDLIKKSFKTFAFSSCVTEVLLGLLCSFVSVFLVATLTVFVKSFGTFSAIMVGPSEYITLLYGALMGLTFGMIKHSKSRTSGYLFILFVIVTSIFVLIVS